jgi:hypothetical protein
MTSLTTYASEDVTFVHNGKTYYGTELYNVGKNLLNKMSSGMVTSGTLTLTSDYLTGYDYTTANKKIIMVPVSQFGYDGQREGFFKTTFMDWFKTVQAMFGLGMGIEYDAVGNEVLRIEPIEYFFTDTEGFSIGTISDLSVSFSKSLAFRRVKIGYTSQEYNTAGLQNIEINAGTEWNIETETISKDLDLISKYRGDGQGVIDFLTGTEDRNYDDIFLIQIYDDTPWKFDDLGRVKITGSGIGTAVILYNSLITPRRNLERWAEYLGNTTYGLDGNDITFSSGDNLISQNETAVDGVTFTPESAPVELAQRTRFFPVIFEIKSDMPIDFIENLISFTNKIITFDFNGFEYGGYIMKVEAELTGKSSHVIQLLASNNYQNALNELINRRNG